MNSPKKKPNWIIIACIIAIGIIILSEIVNIRINTSEIKAGDTYIRFMQDMENENITKAVIHEYQGVIDIITKNGETYSIANPKDDNFRRELLESGINVSTVRYELPEAITSALVSIITSSIMVVMIGVVFSMVSGNTKNNIFKIYTNKDNKITFDQVAGMSEVKEEVKFAISQLKNTDKLESIGAHPCKGIIFEGPPGNGKTLMARAVAGEADVPFISVNGSNFEEMFVGIGAARIRKLWELAEAHAPCVVFIDEIDSVGHKRSGEGNTTSSALNQTINELLGKMDGLEKNKGILVIGATNRINDLDPALLRPGRFDKKIHVAPARTKEDRDAIVRLYLQDKTTDQTFDKASKMMFGFSGAEIEQTLNEAALISLQKGREGVISLEDVDNASMKLMSSGVAVKHVSRKDMLITSIHEAGHAVVSTVLGRKISKVSIVPYNSGVGGVTIQDADSFDDSALYTKQRLLDDITILLAGKAAETVICGSATNGCSNDIEKATTLAYEMLNHFGMQNTSKLANPDTLHNAGISYLRNQNDIIEPINKLLEQCYDNSEKIVRSHIEDLKKSSKELMEKETVYQFQITS